MVNTAFIRIDTLDDGTAVGFYIDYGFMRGPTYATLAIAEEIAERHPGPIEYIPNRETLVAVVVAA